MLYRRAPRLVRPRPVLALVGMLFMGCGGGKFETGDNSSASTTGTTPASPSGSESNSDSGEPALPPNVPPVEPISTLEPPRPPATDTSEAPPATTTGDTDDSTENTANAGDTSETEPTAPSANTEDSTGPEPSTQGEETVPPDTTGEPAAEVPDTEHCAAVADWDPAWAQFEEEVLVLVNENRAAGANCDLKGEFGPADPLAMDPALRCAARLHSMDMYERDYFDHTNPDGVEASARVDAVDFAWSTVGENIAQGQPTPEDVMAAWMESDGHCANVMNPNYTVIGVGYHAGADDWRDGQHFWTQDFARPLMQGGGRR